MPGIIAVFVIGIALIALIVFTSISSARERREREEQVIREAKRREAYIYKKYGHTDDANRIIRRNVWTGETAEQLRDSLGSPLDIDEKVLKTKKKEVWKYNQTGQGRYATRITLDNDIVVGWDDKT